MLKVIENQFRKPKGLLGRIISFTMKSDTILATQKLLEGLKIKDNDNIFEIGYGPGLCIERIMSKHYCYVSGIDFSALMHKEAVKRNKRHIDLKRCQLYLGDFLSINLPRSKYDKIFCLNVIYFWKDLEKPFSKIRSGLKEDGTFHFYMMHSEVLNAMKFTKDDIFQKYSIEEVVDTLELVGFSKVTCKYENGYYIRCKK